MKRLVQGAIRSMEGKREDDSFLSHSSRDRRMVSAVSMNCVVNIQLLVGAMKPKIKRTSPKLNQ